MSAEIKVRFNNFVLVVAIMLFLCVSPASTYAAALPGTPASVTPSISTDAVGLTVSGTAGNYYHYYLNVLLPIGLSPSNLIFGTPSTARPISEYDFISYSGNSLTVDFFYMSDGSSITYQLKSIDSSVDMTESSVQTYGFIGIDRSQINGSTMFIYDKVLALKQWNNTSHYLSSIGSTYALSTTSVEIKDTDTHYDLESRYANAVTNVSSNEYTGVVPTFGQFVQTVGLDSDADSSTGLGPTVNTYNPLESATLTGGLSSMTSFDILYDEWGQFSDRVSTLARLQLSNPNFQYFIPGDFYFLAPRGQDITITPGVGYIFTNGFTPTYITYVIDLDARPSSVSLSGATLINSAYADGRLTIEARRDNETTDSSITLSSIQITLSSLQTNKPIMKISNFCVGTFEIPTMISNMDSTKNQNLIQRGFSNITSAISDLVSGLTLGYNSDTSSELDSFNESVSELDTSTNQYVAAEESAMNASYTSPDGTQSSTVAEYVSDFNPSMSTYPSEIFSGFRIVGLVTNEMYQRSGAFQYVVTFTLTLGCVLFVLGLRRR